MMLSLRDLRGSGRPPWASMAQGAAGHAYALWYLGVRRQRPKTFEHGHRWWRIAVTAAKRRSGFRTRDFAGTPLAASVAHGRPGLHVVEALLAHGRGHPKSRVAAIAKLALAARRSRTASTEYMDGLAGVSTAALWIYRHTSDETARTLADVVIHRLLASPDLAAANFAHGHVGVQHAILAWARSTETALPKAFTAALVMPTVGEIVERTQTWATSWCNGVPGFVLLWVKAHEVTGDDRFRARARDAVQWLIAQPLHRPGTLCCGLGGRAYAALALSRIDHSEDWRAHAIDCCAQALAVTPDNGVFNGLAGLACLAVDLTTPGEARFPLVEP